MYLCSKYEVTLIMTLPMLMKMLYIFWYMKHQETMVILEKSTKDIFTQFQKIKS